MLLKVNNRHHHRVQKRFLVCCLLVGTFALLISFAFLRSSEPSQLLPPSTNLTKAKFDPVFGKEEEQKRLFLNSFADTVSLFRKELNLPDSETVFTSYAPPVDYAHWPRMSNGAISTLPFHTAIFAAGIYNGARIAQLPAFLNQRILDALVDGTTLSVTMTSEYSFHVLSGIFVVKISSPLFEMTQMLYAHKKIQNLFVMDLSVKRPSNLAPRVAPSLTFRLQKSDSNSPDLQKLELVVAEGQSAYGKKEETPLRHWFGQTRLPEWDDNTAFESNNKAKRKHKNEGTYVSIHYDDFPQVLEFKRGRTAERWVFLAAYGGSTRESLTAYHLGKEQIMQESLLDSHAAAWLKTWQNGRLVVRGNSTLSSAVLSAQYALFSEIPTNLNEFDQKFSGLPICGLSPVNMSACEYGLISNDQEYAVVPALFSIQPSLVRQLAFTRVSHLPTAVTNAARVHSKMGAAFPWLTATSGFELHSNSHLARYSKVSSGLVSAAMQMVLQYVSQTDRLIQQAFADAAVAIAEFYASHARSEKNSSSFHIPHVIGPYDQSFVVNNSLPVNLLAKLSLKFASKILPSHADALQWSEVSEKIHIPTAKSWWNVWKVHDGFTYSTDVRLSDFVFLRPEFAGNKLPSKTLFKTMETYLPLYGEQSAFGLSMFVSNYLLTGNYEDATLILERILRQFTSTYYRSLAGQDPPEPVFFTTTQSTNNSDLTPTTSISSTPVKKNSAYWVWLCGPNVMSMNAANCLASASALPYAFTWGWLGFVPSFTAETAASSSPIFVASFRPVSPLPQGVSTVELHNWQLPSFGDSASLTVIWNGTVADFILNGRIKSNEHKNRCRFMCQIGQKTFKFSRKGSLSVKPSGKNFPIKITCVK